MRTDWRPPVPYLVRLRKQSRFAARFGARAWYEYPRIAREAHNKALALRDFTRLLLGPDADCVPLSTYKRFFLTVAKELVEYSK